MGRMQIEGKAVVVTGGASGLGRGIVRALAAAKVRAIMIADVDLKGADALAEEIRPMGIDVATSLCDVASEAAVEELAGKTWSRFGGAELIFPNAGVTAPGDPLKATEGDLRWEFDVNVFGVINSCRVFIRRFLQEKIAGHICVTASHNGIGAPFPNVAGYVATKHAAVGYVDAMRLQYGDRIGFSVLCPGPVRTAVWEGARARPERYGGPVSGDPANEEFLRQKGLDPDMVGLMVTDAIAHGDFYILTDPSDLALVQKRYEEVRSAVQRQFPTKAG
jgi:NAD(P)-dependent dehydrogenase (short-subunit alcohol dehydrogenase family)